MGELVVRFKRSGKAVVYNPKHKEIADYIELEADKAMQLMEKGKAKLFIEANDVVDYRAIVSAVNNSEAIIGGIASVVIYDDRSTQQIILGNVEGINLLLNKNIKTLIGHIMDNNKQAEIGLKCGKNGELDIHDFWSSTADNEPIADREIYVNGENALNKICKMIGDGYSVKTYNGKILTYREIYK